MSESTDDIDFYAQAYQLIYTWLTDEEKIQFNIETLDEKLSFNNERFLPQLLRLIHFLQVKYVNLEKYTDGIFSNLSHISEVDSNKKIQDIVISYEDEKYSLLNLQKTLKREKTGDRFQSFLKETRLKQLYDRYLITLSIKGRKHNGYEYR